MLRWLTTAALLAAAGGAAKQGELVIAPDGMRPSSIAGVPARLRVDPAAPGMPVLNPALAARAGLKPGPFAASYAVGPVTIAGRTAVARIDLGAGPVKRRVTWTARTYSDTADAVVGPGGLPDPVIRFQLRAPRLGERVVALPIAKAGGLFGGWGLTFAALTVDGEPMRVRFDPRRPTTATAGAGVALARAQGGALEGSPTTTDIAWGVRRPVRTLRLERPLIVGPIRLDDLLVRVSDYGGTSSIADAAAPPPDPDEVVVTAKGKRDRSRDVLTIGRDQLDRCSSLTFDKRARQVRLSCA